MAEYLVLARKYRSTTFDEVVGQEPIAQTLKNAIATGRIHHAYLFTGTRGVGKTTMARILAKALNCLAYDQPTITPCGKCESCEAIARGDDVDVIEMDGASNRGIEEIRELRANSIYHPARARYKIYYIDEVHQVTKDAFNALLKTLEEPPEHVKFIFATTESEKVPATILSRCQRFDFRNIPTRDIAGHLKSLCSRENVQADEDALFRIARAAAGSMRDGLSLLDQLLAASAGKVTDADVVRILGTPGDERTLGIAAAISAGDVAGALKQLDAVLESGVTLQSAVTSLGESFRNMMVASVCGASSDLIELPEQQRAALGELAKKFSLPTLVQAVGILQTLLRNIRTSSVARPLAEAAIVRLAAADKFVDPQSLLARLEALSGGAPVKKNLTENRDSGFGARDSGTGTRDSGFAPTGVRTDGNRVSGNPTFVPRTPGIPPSPPAASGGGTAQSPSPAANSSATPSNQNPQSAIRNSPRPAFGDLSSTEKDEIIKKDPSVHAVLDLFGGDVVDIRRNPNAAPQTEEPENG
jgi:DNA polymerase-3 subunit gamma/tau